MVSPTSQESHRQDEIGTPFCVTYDFDSQEDEQVTVRERDTMNQERVSVDRLADYLVEVTDGGVDYSFECVGNVDLMGEALACTHKGWGQSIIIGVAGAGEEIHARPFLLVTGRSWRGSAFGGTRGRTQLPGFVDRYMAGRIAIDELVTETLPLSEINDAFDRMHEGRSIRTVIRFDT